jgi:hypothetical protein
MILTYVGCNMLDAVTHGDIFQVKEPDSVRTVEAVSYVAEHVNAEGRGEIVGCLK